MEMKVHKSSGPLREDASLLFTMETHCIKIIGTELGVNGRTWFVRGRMEGSKKREREKEKERKRGRDTHRLPLGPFFRAHWVAPQWRLCPESLSQA